MAEWWVELKGDPYGLRKLTATHRCAECAVREVDGTFYLTSSRFTDLARGNAVWNAARHLLRCVNALGRLTFATYEPVEAEYVYRRGPDGEFVREPLSPVIHGICATYADGSEAPLREPQVACSLVRLQAEDHDVADATELWALKEHDWATLYKVHEIIERSGGLADAARAAGASEAQLVDFRRTANHQAGAGLIAARHARSATAPPDDPMHIWKAEGLVGRLLLHWLIAKGRGAATCEGA